MKRNTIPNPALAYLIIGLLLTTLTPIISRHLLLPDSIKGFIIGLGLMFEVIALVKIRRSNKDRKCRASTKW